MNNPLDVCLAEAAKARAEAELTALPNVRDRLLRSATAWDAQASNERRFAHLPSRANPVAHHERSRGV
jgi:hypothetical protein